jgi:DNA-binding NarL/FixJ family response regulator
MNKIRIILVDDHKIIRESWSMLLNQTPGFSVIAECENGPEAIEKARELTPDIMLVDINMSVMDGFETTRQLIKNNPSIKVIGISINNQPSFAMKMLSSGAKGYITKSSPLNEITKAIEEVYEGRQYVCEEIKKRMN